MPKTYPKEIDDFIISIKSDVLGSEFKNKFNNLSINEEKSLNTLIKHQKSGEIVIQPADKGSGICILNRVDYEDEVYRQLDEKLTLPNGVEMKYYEKTTMKKLTNSHKIIQQKIQFGLDNGLIDYKIKGDIVTELPRPSKFYLLPKIHKKFTNIPKGRPIVASGGCITEKISWLCDNVAKSNVKE